MIFFKFNKNNTIIIDQWDELEQKQSKELLRYYFKGTIKSSHLIFISTKGFFQKLLKFQPKN